MPPHGYKKKRQRRQEIQSELHDGEIARGGRRRHVTEPHCRVFRTLRSDRLQDVPNDVAGQRILTPSWQLNNVRVYNAMLAGPTTQQPMRGESIGDMTSVDQPP